jgi:alpha-ketoglutarate-dependent 2,4-dichlorophenoxyacetate dioxygenase
LDQKSVSELKQAFARNAVLVIRGQVNVKYEDLGSVARIFGQASACSDITNLDQSGDIMDQQSLDARYARGNELWHMDMLVLECPPLAAMLLARELPATGGGQTQFADQAKAWQRLPASRRKALKELTATHRLETIREKMGITAPEELRSDYAPREHPLVCIDPLSGKPSLLFSAHTSHLNGLSSDDSRLVLTELLQCATEPDGVYTHTWQQHDLVIWNNRRTLHRVLPYDAVHARRRLWRMEILTDHPPARKVGSSWLQMLWR